MKIKEVPIQDNYPVHWGTIFQSKFLLAVKLYSLCCYCCTQVIFCTAIYQMGHIWAAAHRPKKSPGLVILEQLGHYFRSVIMEDPVGLNIWREYWFDLTWSYAILTFWSVLAIYSISTSLTNWPKIINNNNSNFCVANLLHQILFQIQNNIFIKSSIVISTLIFLFRQELKKC